MSKKYKKRRTVAKLDPVTSPFYVYCLYYTKIDEIDQYNEENVFYIGKAKNKTFDCLRRENEHMEEAYSTPHQHFHKSRKIRLLENEGYLILSKVLEEFNDEMEAYTAELKWFNKFKDKGIDLTNMVDCGIRSVGSGETHPSYDFEIRRKTVDIVKLYIDELWPITRIAKHFNKSAKLIKEILHEAGVKFRTKNIRSIVWLSKNDIINSYLTGDSLNILAKKYNCSMNHIRNILVSENIHIKDTESYKRSPAWEFSKQIHDAYHNGIFKKLLCIQYKCDLSTINSILKTYDNQ